MHMLVKFRFVEFLAGRDQAELARHRYRLSAERGHARRFCVLLEVKMPVLDAKKRVCVAI